MSCKITTGSIKKALTPTWCPGCGNFMILNALQKSLVELKLNQKDTVIFYGIGCNSNMADFNRAYGFHGLHGRALPNAIGAKLANHDLKIIVIAGDGDFYGEGLNHFISLARGNHDVTVIIHDNSRYSLTTGQSSPTTKKGTQTKSTPTGLIEKPFNPILSGIAAGASFVSRTYSSKLMQMVQLIKAGLTHPGFALIDVIQLCPSFNKKENQAYFAERIYDLVDKDHDPHDKTAAMMRAQETEKIPLGLFYQDQDSRPYHTYISWLDDKTLIQQRSNQTDITAAMTHFA